MKSGVLTGRSTISVPGFSPFSLVFPITCPVCRPPPAQTLLQAFDQPTIEINCSRRSQSTVATQALTLWNSRWMEKAAESFATRVADTDNRRVADRAIGLAYARPPTDKEHQVIVEFLSEQSRHHLTGADGKPVASDTARRRAIVDLCHMLLSSNEFAYID